MLCVLEMRSNAAYGVAYVLYYVRSISHWDNPLDPDCFPRLCISKLPRLTFILFLGLPRVFHTMYSSQEKINDVVSLVFSYYRDHGREFPWRETFDPYCILVSEYMLQQTQVDRVIPKYLSFLRAFPCVTSLASAERRDVLALWSGLGYNRRAVALHDAAKMLVAVYGGSVPMVMEDLLMLPGVGVYTAGAVLAFAYDQPAVIVETNIRTVVFQHCVRGKDVVNDAVIRFFVGELLYCAINVGISSRIFYSAMMDYGSHLKSVGIRVNSRSQHYVKQGKFDGSVRQARGALLRFFVDAEKGVSRDKLGSLSIRKVEEGLSGLVADGLVERRGRYYYLV